MYYNIVHKSKIFWERVEETKSVLITPEGIQKNLKNVKPLDAICEYIWNDLGINYDELKFKFQPFNDSRKANILSRANHSLPQGDFYATGIFR